MKVKIKYLILILLIPIINAFVCMMIISFCNKVIIKNHLSSNGESVIYDNDEYKRVSFLFFKNNDDKYKKIVLYYDDSFGLIENTEFVIFKAKSKTNPVFISSSFNNNVYLNSKISLDSIYFQISSLEFFDYDNCKTIQSVIGENEYGLNDIVSEVSTNLRGTGRKYITIYFSTNYDNKIMMKCDIFKYDNNYYVLWVDGLIYDLQEGFLHDLLEIKNFDLFFSS